jgi:hypothetical protein
MNWKAVSLSLSLSLSLKKNHYRGKLEEERSRREDRVQPVIREHVQGIQYFSVFGQLQVQAESYVFT